MPPKMTETKVASLYKIADTPHTAMMKVSLRPDETRTYLRQLEPGESMARQRERAWDEQWFGFLPEHMFDALSLTLHDRFGQFPALTAVLKRWLGDGLENHDFRLICHLHIQLTDAFYRWGTGVYLAQRFDEGYQDVSTPILAKPLQQVTEAAGKRFTPATLTRIAVSILSTARDVGLLTGTQKKHFATPIVTVDLLAYLLYGLQHFGLAAGDLPDSPYLRSLLLTPERLRALLQDGQRRDWWEFNWTAHHFGLQLRYPSLAVWYEEAR
jgi:hypothetical protein